MRLNDDVWRHTCSYGAAAELARLAVVGAAQRGAVAASVGTKLRRPGATTRDLYLAELRARSSSLRIAHQCDHENDMYVVTRDGALVQINAGADADRNAGDAWFPSQRWTLLGGARVVSVSAGARFLSAVTDAAHVFSMGCNEWGQLGLGWSDHDMVQAFASVQSFARIETLSDIVSVACGYDYAIAVARDGSSYCWGRGDDFPVQCNDAFTGVEPRVETPTRLDTGGARIVAACAGDNANILITASGKLLGCGRNRHGELGVGDDMHRDDFVQLGGDQLRGECIVKASTSYGCHTLAMTATGTCYGFGSNERGQLGKTDRFDRLSPELIPIPNVTDIYAIDIASYVVRNGKELHCMHLDFESDDDGDPIQYPPSMADGLIGGICGGVDALSYLTSPKESSSEFLYEWVPGDDRPPRGGPLE